MLVIALILDLMTFPLMSNGFNVGTFETIVKRLLMPKSIPTFGFINVTHFYDLTHFIESS